MALVTFDCLHFLGASRFLAIGLGPLTLRLDEGLRGWSDSSRPCRVSTGSGKWDVGWGAASIASWPIVWFGFVREASEISGLSGLGVRVKTLD